MSNATCTLTSCSPDGSLGGFGSVLVWLSHVLIGISALSYSIAFNLIWDATANVKQIHAMDPVLKENGIKSADKVYEVLANCEDQVVKHIAFWLLSLQRTWACFQTALGVGLWCIIFMMPIKHRAPVHFLVGYLQMVVGLVASSLAFGGPFPDSGEVRRHQAWVRGARKERRQRHAAARLDRQVRLLQPRSPGYDQCGSRGALLAVGLRCRVRFRICRYRT